jgi:hypothetical protein
LHYIRGMMKKTMIKLARGRVISGFDTSLRLPREVCDPEKHLHWHGRRIGVSREREFGPTLADRQKIAEGGIHAASER